MRKQVTLMLAEVCEDLAKICEKKSVFKKGKKKYGKYNKTFKNKAELYRKLANNSLLKEDAYRQLKILEETKMGQEFRRYNEIPKRTRNAIRTRLKGIEKQYNYNILRKVALKYFEEIREKQQLEQQIEEAEAKLQELKSMKN